MQEYEDGVYFNMPDTDYHKIAALSASGIKNILISPLDFWARSWMNPAYNLEEDTEAQICGTAYHKRICEGKEAFYAQYAPAFQGEDLPTRVSELQATLSKRGFPSSGNKDELEIRCARFGIKTYASERAAYYDENDGKIFLSQDLIEGIEISAAMIEMHPELSRCFKGGYPEVTVLWTEEFELEEPNDDIDWETVAPHEIISPTKKKKVTVRFKARFDYLKLRAIVDLKTFENRAMQAVTRAVYKTIASYKYHIQAAFYQRAVDVMKRLPMWHGCTIEFREKFIQTDEHDFYFVFQQKGIAPFARGYKFPRTTMWSVGNAQIDAGIKLFLEYTQEFGDGQWVDCAEIETLQDEGFPVWASTDL